MFYKSGEFLIYYFMLSYKVEKYSLKKSRRFGKQRTQKCTTISLQ